MPKFPKGFGRRKSTANALEDLANAPNAPSVEHSFKVFERPGGIGKSFDGGVKLVKGLTTNRPTTSYKEDNIFEGITGNRSVPDSFRHFYMLYLNVPTSRFLMC